MIWRGFGCLAAYTWLVTCPLHGGTSGGRLTMLWMRGASHRRNPAGSAECRFRNRPCPYVHAVYDNVLRLKVTAPSPRWFASSRLVLAARLSITAQAHGARSPSNIAQLAPRRGIIDAEFPPDHAYQGAG